VWPRARRAPPHNPSTAARPPRMDARIGEGAHGGAGLPPSGRHGRTPSSAAREENGREKRMSLGFDGKRPPGFILTGRKRRPAIRSDPTDMTHRADCGLGGRKRGGRNLGLGPGCGLGAGALASTGSGPWATLCWAAAVRNQNIPFF
jgi:hypothetical protein